MAKTRVRLSQTEENQRSLKERLELSTAEIGLTVRTTNCLEERGIFTVEDLLNTNRTDLLSIQNFGEKTLEEVYKALEAIGFYRPGHEPAIDDTTPETHSSGFQQSVFGQQIPTFDGFDKETASPDFGSTVGMDSVNHDQQFISNPQSTTANPLDENTATGHYPQQRLPR